MTCARAAQGSINLNGILDLVFFPNKSDQIQMLQTYEKHMDKLVAEVNKSKRSIMFTSKNIDMKIIDSLIESMNRGVKVKVISEKYDFEDKINKLQMMLSP